MPSPERSYTSRGEKGETPEPDAWAALSETAFAEDWNSVLDADYDVWEHVYHRSRSRDGRDPKSNHKG